MTYGVLTISWHANHDIWLRAPAVNFRLPSQSAVYTIGRRMADNEAKAVPRSWRVRMLDLVMLILTSSIRYQFAVPRLLVCTREHLLRV